MMRRTLILIASTVVLFASIGSPARALGGAAKLYGGDLVEDPPWCGGDQYCLIHHLGWIHYSGSTDANVVTFSSLSPHSDTECFGEGPGSCREFGTDQSFEVIDPNATMQAGGLCRATVGIGGSCRSTYDYYVGTPSAADPLPVTIDLGGGNDAFADVLDPTLTHTFEFHVNGGSGSDKIVLLDVTGGGDTITCGDGADTVITGAATTVAADCEKVVRVTGV